MSEVNFKISLLQCKEQNLAMIDLLSNQEIYSEFEKPHEDFQRNILNIRSKCLFNQDKLIKLEKNSLTEKEIIIYVGGTTSSGKSTLINLLCGEFIMPESIGEMSDGMVEIEHSTYENILLIKNTKNAAWEIGEFKNLSANEIQNKLATVMLKYHALKEKDIANKIECPQIKLKYATKLAKDLPALRLHENQNFILKILNLPLLKHLSDQKNAEVINLYCKNALPILTYNAAETDEIKQEALLEQLVGQVKEIGGSPARMLFVLNRFDVFEADMNPEESKKNVREKLTKKIKDTLSKELPEYVQAIAKIQLVPLATKPSLLAEVNEFKLLEKFFGYLMDENILNELHRNSDKWSDEDKNLVKNDILKKSNLQEFQSLLFSKIKRSFQDDLYQLKEIEQNISNTFKDFENLMKKHNKTMNMSKKSLFTKTATLVQKNHTIHEMRQLLHEDKSKLIAELKKLIDLSIFDLCLNHQQANDLNQKIKHLEDLHFEKDQYEIDIAVFGTTSAGKSTMINFLCGATLLPEGVGEMSAGVVEIIHSDQKRLVIEKTKNMQWKNDSFINLKDEDILSKVYDILMIYQKHRHLENVDPPIIKIFYPTMIGSYLKNVLMNLNVNKKLSFKLIDLPGLKNSADQKNLKVIQKYSKASIYLMTYNAAETDHTKQAYLLDEILKQVFDHQIDPKQMIFILNRFDVLATDDKRLNSEKKTYDAFRNQILHQLNQFFPKNPTLNQIKMIKFSSKPALLSQLNHIHSINTLNKFFSYMVDPVFLEDLPRPISKWPEETSIKFRKIFEEKSFVQDFLLAISAQFGDHFFKAQMKDTVIHFKNQSTLVIETFESQIKKYGESQIQKVNQMIKSIHHLKNKNVLVGSEIQQLLEIQKHIELTNEINIGKQDYLLQRMNETKMIVEKILDIFLKYT